MISWILLRYVAILGPIIGLTYPWGSILSVPLLIAGVVLLFFRRWKFALLALVPSVAVVAWWVILITGLSLSAAAIQGAPDSQESRARFETLLGTQPNAGFYNLSFYTEGTWMDAATYFHFRYTDNQDFLSLVQHLEKHYRYNLNLSAIHREPLSRFEPSWWNRNTNTKYDMYEYLSGPDDWPYIMIWRDPKSQEVFIKHQGH